MSNMQTIDTTKRMFDDKYILLNCKWYHYTFNDVLLNVTHNYTFPFHRHPLTPLFVRTTLTFFHFLFNTVLVYRITLIHLIFITEMIIYIKKRNNIANFNKNVLALNLMWTFISFLFLISKAPPERFIAKQLASFCYPCCRASSY